MVQLSSILCNYGVYMLDKATLQGLLVRFSKNQSLSDI